MKNSRFEELVTLLAIDRHDLDIEISRQPTLYMEICDAQVMAVSRSDAAYDEVKRVAAEVDLRIREEHEGERITEKQVEALVQTSEDYVNARQDYRDKKYLADRLTALKESFYQRSFMLRDLASITVAGSYANSSYDDPENAPGQAAVRAKYNKERMVEKRKDIKQRIKRKKGAE